jgi:hypothetical protein
LTGGFTVRFGVWLAVHPDDLQRAFRVWWEPQYRGLVLDGWLANDLPFFGLQATAAQARVLDDAATPFVVDSSDESLTRVLTKEWPHQELLSVLSLRT